MTVSVSEVAIEEKGEGMSDAVYSKSEIVGTSRAGLEDAINNGITRARKTLRHLDWFEVTEIRGYLGGDSGEDFYYQVTMKVGFRVEE
jgi:flavin-binding protein dodecin